MIFHCRDAEEAEAIACREGVHLALRWPDAPMILESDCHSMVAKLRANVRDRSSIWQIIEEAQEVGGQLRRLELVKISRVQNNLPHELAQFSITSRESRCFFFSCFLEWVSSLSCKDIT